MNLFAARSAKSKQIKILINNEWQLKRIMCAIYNCHRPEWLCNSWFCQCNPLLPHLSIYFADCCSMFSFRSFFLTSLPSSRSRSRSLPFLPFSRALCHRFAIIKRRASLHEATIVYMMQAQHAPNNIRDANQNVKICSKRLMRLSIDRTVYQSLQIFAYFVSKAWEAWRVVRWLIQSLC